jgi:hypothetical protein
MGGTHKSTFLWCSEDGMASIISDSPMIWVESVQIMKFVYKDGPDLFT